MLASTVTVWPTPTVALFFTVPIPLNSNVSSYWPDGRPRSTYTPFTSLTAVFTPCCAGDCAVTVAPGTVAPSGEVIVPVTTPF
jgi:hypothetical protein